MLLTQLLRAPGGSRLVRTNFDGITLALGIATTQSHACCPLCGVTTWRVHSRYTRQLAEESVLGHPVRLEMNVRRFFCAASPCQRRIFAEPLDGFAARHARTTLALAQTHRATGWQQRRPCPPAQTPCCVASRTSTVPHLKPCVSSVSTTGPGARVSATARSSSTWRRTMSSTCCQIATPQLSRPGSRLIPASNWSVATAPRPTRWPLPAQQVADRWHLLKNVREAVERLLEGHVPAITEALKPADPDPGSMANEVPREEPGPAIVTEPTPQETPPASPRQEAARAKRQRRVEQFERVHELRRQGMPIRQIARELVMSRKAVRRYLRREHCPEWRRTRVRRSAMDAHREWIDACIAEGRTNASELHRELASSGVRLSYAAVRRYLTKRLGRAGKSRPRVNAAKPKPTRPPSARQLSFDWVRRPEKRTAETQARLNAIRTVSAGLTAALDLADEFTSMIRKQSTGTLVVIASRGQSLSRDSQFCRRHPPR